MASDNEKRGKEAFKGHQKFGFFKSMISVTASPLTCQLLETSRTLNPGGKQNSPVSFRHGSLLYLGVVQGSQDLNPEGNQSVSSVPFVQLTIEDTLSTRSLISRLWYSQYAPNQKYDSSFPYKVDGGGGGVQLNGGQGLPGGQPGGGPGGSLQLTRTGIRNKMSILLQYIFNVPIM